jgi:hypothetical protein
LGVLALCLCVSHAGYAQPPDEKAACVTEYENAQVLRQHGRLLEAREALGACSREMCPALVRADCGNWLEDIGKEIPSVVVQATCDGAEIADVQVFIDGKLVTGHLDGKAIQADPGLHRFRFETPGYPAALSTVVVREGEHYRPLSVSFLSRREPLRTTRPVPVPVWILGGAAVVGAASFATFAVLGNQKKNSLMASCAPFCSADDVGSVQHEYLVADVSLAIGVAALAAGTFLFLTRPEKPLYVGVAPSPGGVALMTRGRF